MGFCGCSLRQSTTSAAIYGIVFSIYGIIWTSVAIDRLHGSFQTNNSYSSLFSFENLIYLRNNAVVFALICTSLALHCLWFLSSSFLILGNVKNITGCLYLWVWVTISILITDFGSAIYCIIKAVNVTTGGITIFDIASQHAAPFYGYILICALFNKLGLISMGIQISLVIYVNRRAKEIIQKEKGPHVAVISHPPGGQMHPLSDPVPYPMHFQPPNMHMQHYSPNLQHYSPNMQPLQPPNMQPFQHKLAEEWNQPSSQYTEHGINRTDKYPYERDHKCESRTYLQNRPVNPYRYHSQEELTRDDQFPPHQPGTGYHEQNRPANPYRYHSQEELRRDDQYLPPVTRYHEPKPDYNYYEGSRY